MAKNLTEINKLRDRISGIMKDRYSIRAQLEAFETAGRGFYLKGTIENFAKIRSILELMDEQATAEIEILMKKLLD